MSINQKLIVYYNNSVHIPKSYTTCKYKNNCCKKNFCNSPFKCCNVWEREDLSDDEIKHITSYIRNNITFDKFILIFNNINLMDCLYI